MSVNAEKSEINDPQSTSIARGKRLKTLRKMSDLSRERMEEKYSVSANTIQSWEAAKAGGLTRKGAERIITAFHHEGISCTIEWLLYGVGAPPMLRTAERHIIHETAGLYTALPEDKAIIEELQTFRTLNKTAVDIIIADNGMSPHFKPGDYVAGKRRTGNDIERYVGQNCIVEISTNEILLRRIQHRNHQGLYTLGCINPDTSVRLPTLYEQKLISAAPVIWHRRPDAYLPQKLKLSSRVKSNSGRSKLVQSVALLEVE
jgi:transcriptional regulator with XRE-family HTH domain